MSMFDSAKVLYKLVDPTIANDTRTDATSSDSDFSDTENLDNLLNKKKGAYLEKDYFVLDGTHTFLAAGDDVGWESENFSNNVDSEVSNSLLTITESIDNNLIALKEIVGNTVGATSITSPVSLTVCTDNLFNIDNLKRYAGGWLYNDLLYYTVTPPSLITATNQVFNSSIPGYRCDFNSTFTVNGETNLTRVQIFYRCFNASVS